MNAVKIETMKRYRAAYGSVWQYITTLTQIVSEDYPDPDLQGVEPTRYQIDMLNGLAGSLSALVEGHERG